MKNLNNTIAPIGISANGIEVFPHPEGHSHRPDLDAEAISKINLPKGTFCRTTVDMGRIIGKDHLVEIAPDALTFYWKRGNRPGASRMVLQDADDTSYVTVILCIAHEEEGTPAELVGKWVLVTLFEGCPGEREPFDRSFEKKAENEEVAEAFWASIEFWKTHALVPTDAEMQEIKSHNGWHFCTYENGVPHENVYEDFATCIADYNTALACFEMETWMEGVDEPTTID